MDTNNRPLGRDKNVTSGSSSVNKRGSGLGTGPVGNANGYQSKSGSSGSGSSNGSGKKSGKGLGVGAVGVLAGLFFLIKSFFGGGDDANVDPSSLPDLSSNTVTTEQSISQNSQSSYETSEEEYLSMHFGSQSSASPNATVASDSRAKRTTILGNGKDVVTIMMYMCGTDLESKHGMATSDLTEMCKATIGTNLNLIVYTGGCKKWKNSNVSNSVNQIYQIKNGAMTCLESDMGTDSLLKPETLTSFIGYCTKNFPANRQCLIFWDHGGGSISGFGYDEKDKKVGSMTLAGINSALKNSGTTFDFIGFDACLMATLENGLMLSKYADYMIASEETEPGVGWYYTNWLSKLSADTSMSTVNIGKNIIDDFVDVCSSKCPKQSVTLSIVDLAELENTVPDSLNSFAGATNQLIHEEKYKKVSDARNSTKEFAASSKIDQIDLVDFAKKMGTTESLELANDLLGAIKYNRTSASINTAYGLSIYFPYKKASRVDSAINTYKAIGMDSEYSTCIKEFAGLEVCGQASQGGSHSVLSTLLGTYSDYSSSSSGGSVDSILSILSGLTTGKGISLPGGIGSTALDFLSEQLMSNTTIASFLSNNYFDATKLVWTKNSKGSQVIELSEDQWKLIESVDLNVWVDDGEGYIDLGLDNICEYDENGNLLGDFDNTWLAINGQIVPYYHTDTFRDGNKYTINGYVPAFLNGERVKLLLVFDNEHPYGYISGARTVYTDGETETEAKNTMELKSGDKLDFICDYYTYSGEYRDSYYLGNQMTLGNTIQISNVTISGGKAKATYRFTDMYNQEYWTPTL